MVLLDQPGITSWSVVCQWVDWLGLAGLWWPHWDFWDYEQECLSLHNPMWSSSSRRVAQISSHREFQELQKRTSPTSQELFKSSFASCLLASYWPKQVTWLSPASEWKGTQSNMAIRIRCTYGVCVWGLVPFLQSSTARQLAGQEDLFEPLGCELQEASVWGALNPPELGIEQVLGYYWLLLQYPHGQLEPLTQRNGQRTQREASFRKREGKTVNLLYNFAQQLSVVICPREWFDLIQPQSGLHL